MFARAINCLVGQGREVLLLSRSLEIQTCGFSVLWEELHVLSGVAAVTQGCLVSCQVSLERFRGVCVIAEAIKCGVIWDPAQSCPTSRRVPEGARLWHVGMCWGAQGNSPGDLLHTSSLPLTSSLKCYLKSFPQHFQVEQKQIEGLTGNLGGHIIFSHGIWAIIPPLEFNREWKR